MMESKKMDSKSF